MKKWMRYAGGLALSLVLLLLFAACTEPTETSPEPEAGQEQVETTGPEGAGEETAGEEKTTPETEEPSWTEESLSMLQNGMAQEGALCGAAYIGPADDYAKSEDYPLIQYYAETYPFVADIPRERWVQAGGRKYTASSPAPTVPA